MILLRNFTLLLCLALLSGCVVKNVGTTVEHTFKGDYYLENQKFEQGRESFAREVQQNPNSALAHYYYGRFLLQDNDHEQALTHLKKARDLDPRKPDYHFWTGVAFGGIKDIKNEEASYRTALKLDDNHLQSLIYLGHVELRGKRYDQALELYGRAIAIWPASPSALYNRALILKKLDRTPEEQRGWLDYLYYYPSGAKTRRAVENLNLLNDFTYRNHLIGVRTITTEKIWFVPFSAELDSSSYASLNLIGEVFANLDRGKLQIIVYQKNNTELARNKALAIKRYLVDEFPSIESEEVGISWFPEPHKEKIRNENLTIDESVDFFVTSD